MNILTAIWAKQLHVFSKIHGRTRTCLKRAGGGGGGGGGGSRRDGTWICSCIQRLLIYHRNLNDRHAFIAILTCNLDELTRSECVHINGNNAADKNKTVTTVVIKVTMTTTAVTMVLK